MKKYFKLTIIPIFLLTISCSETQTNEANDLNSRANELEDQSGAKEIVETVKEEIKEQVERDTSFIKTNYFDISGSFKKQALELLYVTSLDSLSINKGETSELERYLREALIDKYDFDGTAFGENAGSLITEYFEGIYVSLPDFIVAPERHDGYYSQRNEIKSSKEKLLAYLVYRIDRSPENIRKIWEHKKHFFYGHILPQGGTRKVIQDLDQSYRYLMTVKNYTSKLDSAYQSIDSLNQQKQYPEYKPGAYGISSYDVFEFLEPITKGDTTEYNRKEWAYSFWMRRQHEGNFKEVASILEEIINHK